MVINVAAHEGDRVKQGQKLFVLEAMQMEAIIAAPRDGRIAQVLVGKGSQVESGDLLLTLEPPTTG
jgi:pyruvate carboxylase